MSPEAQPHICHSNEAHQHSHRRKPIAYTRKPIAHDTPATGHHRTNSGTGRTRRVHTRRATEQRRSPRTGTKTPAEQQPRYAEDRTDGRARTEEHSGDGNRDGAEPSREHRDGAERDGPETEREQDHGRFRECAVCARLAMARRWRAGCLTRPNLGLGDGRNSETEETRRKKRSGEKQRPGQGGRLEVAEEKRRRSVRSVDGKSGRRKSGGAGR